MNIIHNSIIEPNRLDLKKLIKIYGKISRQPWARLWYLARGCDHSGSGKVILLKPEIYCLLCCSRATLYRWLAEGKEAGAFRHYESKSHYLVIYLGSRDKIYFSNWGAVTIAPLWQILSDDLQHQGLRQEASIHTAQHLQTRSKAAAVKSKRRKKDKRRLATIDFRRATENNQTCQFFRNKLPIGASQETIGKTIGISDRSVRRHLAAAKINSVQALHKIKRLEGEAELFNAAENWKKPKVFYRQGEYFKYGCNQYDLNYTQLSQWTARIKHKWKLLKVFRVFPNSQYKNYLWVFEDLGIVVDFESLIHSKNFREFKKMITRAIRQSAKILGGDP